MMRHGLLMSKLPEGWANINLSDVCTLLNGRAYKKHELLDSGKYPVLRVGNLFTNPKWYYSDLELEENKYCDNGDLLYAWSASFGPKVWDGAKVIFHYHIWKVVPHSLDISKQFLFHYFTWDKEDIKSEEGTGSTMIHVTKQAMQSRKVPFPPHNEQKRIANKVEALFARSDKAKNALDAISALLDEYRQSILTATFRGDLTKDWRKKQPKISTDNFSLLSDNSYYDDMFNNVPETWDIKVIDNIITGIQSGKSFKCIERPPKLNEKGIIKLSAVSWGSFNEDQSKTVTDNSRLNEKAKIYEGDLLFSRANTVELVGACLITGKFKKDLYLSDKTLRLDVPEEYKIYLKWFLRSPSGRKQIEKMATGAQLSMRNISQSSLKNITMPFPPKEEILIICQALEKMEKFLDQISYRINTSHLELNTLNQSILAKTFQGKLVPQDPNDEPASVLLKRIQIEREKLEKELKGKKKVDRKKSNGKGKKMIIPVVDALKQSEKPLSAQQLLSAAGYPNNADTDQIEQFFLDIRKAINGMQVETWRENDQDYFKVAG